MKRIALLLILGIVTGCDSVIFEEDISEEKVILLAPTNAVEILKGDIAFHWEAVQDSAQYLFQIATPNFLEAEQIVKDSVMYETKIKVFLDTGYYEWRVKAINSAYNTSFSSNQFIVKEE